LWRCIAVAGQSAAFGAEHRRLITLYPGQIETGERLAPVACPPYILLFRLQSKVPRNADGRRRTTPAAMSRQQTLNQPGVI